MKIESPLSVVVPVYNSEASLGPLIERLRPLLSTDSEVILINDGSRDRSWDRICGLAERYPWVRGISLMRNYGQHNALLCGIRAVRNQVIVTMDDDLQNPPEEIPKLLEKLEGYDVVYGTPEVEQHGLWRDAASRITKLALKSAIGAETARNVSAFRAFRTEVRGGFVNYQGPFVSIDVLMTWGTSRFTSVRVRHEPRCFGTSNYTFQKLVRHAFNMMTGFSVLPLQIASVIGFAFTVFGFCILVFVVARYIFQGASVPGFPFLASMIAIFSGVQMFSLGIIGEYLARMHFRMMDRPAYTVREDTASTADHVSSQPTAGTNA
jgi:glycosyltransferase involved in cell wall biosynthesis